MGITQSPKIVNADTKAFYNALQASITVSETVETLKYSFKINFQGSINISMLLSKSANAVLFYNKIYVNGVYNQNLDYTDTSTASVRKRTVNPITVKPNDLIEIKSYITVSGQTGTINDILLEGDYFIKS